MIQIQRQTQIRHLGSEWVYAEDVVAVAVVVVPRL